MLQTLGPQGPRRIEPLLVKSSASVLQILSDVDVTWCAAVDYCSQAGTLREVPSVRPVLVGVLALVGRVVRIEGSGTGSGFSRVCA